LGFGNEDGGLGGADAENHLSLVQPEGARVVRMLLLQAEIIYGLGSTTATTVEESAATTK
jgi:hypothetical protein